MEKHEKLAASRWQNSRLSVPMPRVTRQQIVRFGGQIRMNDGIHIIGDITKTVDGAPSCRREVYEGPAYYPFWQSGFDFARKG